MIRTIIAIVLAVHFLSDPVGNVQQGVEVGAPIVIALFENVLTPAIRQVQADAEAVQHHHQQQQQ